MTFSISLLTDTLPSISRMTQTTNSFFYLVLFLLGVLAELVGLSLCDMEKGVGDTPFVFLLSRRIIFFFSFYPRHAWKNVIWYYVEAQRSVRSTIILFHKTCSPPSRVET